MQPWKTHSRRFVLDYGKYLLLEEHVVELPDGRLVPRWPWLVMPAYAIVVAQAETGEFLLFRQPKYGVHGLSLAPVGGYLEPGEDPAAGAARELLEETGYQASLWSALGAFVVDANRGAGVAHLFLARGARRVASPHVDDLEEQELLLLSRPELEQALASGEIKVLPWAAAFALALLRLSPG